MNEINHEKIKTLRKKTGLSQTEFAEKIGIARSYLNQIENGKIKPSLTTLEKIARGLGKNLKDFF